MKNKLPRNQRHKDLPSYYQMVRNKRTGYTKLVTTEKAIELVHGKLFFGERHKLVKDDYVAV